MNHWLIKTDPETYSWEDFKKEGSTSWDGIRNYAARNHLKAMKKGDKVLFYHSGGECEIRGVAIVTKEFYQDPTTEESAWVSIFIKSSNAFKNVVSLQQIRKNTKLKNMLLIKISRLSVMPVTNDEYNIILELSEV